MLMPAAVLVLVVLGAIAVDFSIAFLGERELANAASAAANDAAAAAVDQMVFRTTGQVVLDCARANDIAQASFRARLASWMKAADMPPPTCDGNRASSPHTGGINAALADGSVRFIAAGVSPGTWWALMTPNSGDIPGSNW